MHNIRQIPIFRSDPCGIAHSTISEAGWGLFALRTIPTAQRICCYRGTNLTSAQGAASSSRYLYSDPSFPDQVIDATDPLSCHGRYANDPLNDHLVNAKITHEIDSDGNIFAYLIATLPISPGHEIFVSYGPDYYVNPDLCPDYRAAASVAYPRLKHLITAAAGEGTCAHPQCVALRMSSVQTHLTAWNSSDQLTEPPRPARACCLPRTSRPLKRKRDEHLTRASSLLATSIPTTYSITYSPPPPLHSSIQYATILHPPPFTITCE